MRRLLTIVSICLYLFLYAPIVVVILFSFNDNPHGASWTGFTAHWYMKLVRNPDILQAFKNTLWLGGISTFISTILGTLLGIGLNRYNFRGKRWLTSSLYFPVAIPDIIMAVALMLFYGIARQMSGVFDLGMTTMILGHITFQIPFVAIVVRARLSGLDPALEEAAQDLGANAWQIFWRINLPLLTPGILAGALLAFTLSLDDFIVSFFTTGPGATTLPIYIYSSVKRGITPEINAVSSLMIVASISLVLLLTLLDKKSLGSFSK